MSSLFPRPTGSPGRRPDAQVAPARTPALHLVETAPVPVRPVPARVMAVKRGVDIVLALLFFVAMGWLYGLVWLGVRISSGGPAIYTQLRYGRDGQVFTFYKFRSMVRDADTVLMAHLRSDAQALAQWQTYQKLEHDPRITRFGAFIRRYSLDELPQMWNVLRGDMSLIGPRPCMCSQKELYGSYWAHYCAVRPGVTGLWQVSGRNGLSFQRRAALDAEYVNTLSARRDLSILLKTFGVVASARHSR